MIKDDFQGALGEPVDQLVKGWVASEGGVYAVSITDNHFRFLLRNGLSIPPSSALAVEFSGTYPRIVAIGKNLNVQTHGPLNPKQAAWLLDQLKKGTIKRIFAETGTDGTSVQINLKKQSPDEAVAILQDYFHSTHTPTASPPSP